MTNNAVLVRLKNIFDLSQPQIIDLFNILDIEASQDSVQSWFKNPADADFVVMEDVELSALLNALICHNRGKKEGPQPEPEKKISNNIIFKKLKIAMDLKNEEILELFKNENVTMNPYELTAFFRKSNHKNYRPLRDQLLQSFLKALESKK